VVQEWERTFGPMPAPMRGRWLANDHLAMAAAWTAPGQPSAVIDILDDLTTPSLLYVGGDDHHREDIARPSEAMPAAELVTIPGLNHMDAFYRHDLVVPHARRFLERL
jgi:pimeloyl-ACP methyl ester carboxylesterase